MTETNEAGQWRSYQYDALNNMTRVRERNGRVLQYGYDLLGQMTSEQWRSGADPGPSITLVTTADGGPIDEVQRVGFSTTGSFLSGSTFKLTYSGQTTASIAYTATAAQVQAALEALSNVAPGDVVVTQTQNTSKTKEWRLTFGGALGDANLSQTTVDITGLQGIGTKTKIEATDVQGSSTGNEIQTVTLSNATGGTFRLAFEGHVTAPLAYNATAGQVETALEALNSVDNVTVTGNAGGPWTVTYGGTQANTDVVRLDGDVTAATNGTLVRTLSYTYDAAGQLSAASDPDSSYAVSYDNLGRVLTVDNNGTSGVPRVILTSAYDAAGNRSSLSASVAGTADFLNTYTHDALDRLTRVDQTGQGGNTVSEKRVDLAYNALGQFTSIARYKDTDGGTTHEVATAGYSYDTLSRLTGLAYTKGGTNLFTPYSWTYDGLSSPGMDFSGTATVADPRVSATGASAVFAGLGRITQMVGQDGTSNYGYDATSQLTSATHTYQSNETYPYDANGNRTMTGYQTGTDNRLTNDGTYSYTYDAEGNRLTRTKTFTGEVTEYTWDYRNRLTKVTEKNAQGAVTQVVEYVYDVFDRRIGRKIDTSAPFDMANAVIERYVLDDIHNGLASADGGNVVLDFVDPDGSGAQAIAMSKRYLYGEAVDQIFAQEDLSKTLGDAARNLWPLVDHLGTVRDLAKQDGAIAAHYKYDSFGNVTSGDTSKTRYLFTGREFDTATKLQYNRARYYDPAVGRWISEDPLGFTAGDVNVARYVGNGPTLATDPSGLQAGDWLDRNFGGGVYGEPGISGRIFGWGRTLLGFAPIAGDIADVGEVVIGLGPNGERLTPAERAVTAVAAALPFVPGGPFRKIIKELGILGDAGDEVIEVTDEVTDTFRHGDLPERLAPGEIRPDLFRTGNAKGTAPIRVGEDGDIIPDAAGNVHPTNPPSGVSAFDCIDDLPTTGRVWKLPGEAELPDGVGAFRDPPPRGHFSIGPTQTMSFEEFLEEYGKVPWVDTGRKIK